MIVSIGMALCSCRCDQRRALPPPDQCSLDAFSYMLVYMVYNDRLRKRQCRHFRLRASWGSSPSHHVGPAEGSAEVATSRGGGMEMPRSVASTSSQRSRWAQTPTAIEITIQHDCSEIEVVPAPTKHSFSYSSGPPEDTRFCTRTPRRDMQARTKFRKKFMSSEETKSPIRVRRENIHLAWVSVSFDCSGTVSIQ